MKKIPTDKGFRRGVINFLRINDLRQDAIFKQVYGSKILILDDEEPIRKVLRLMVEIKGLELELDADNQMANWYRAEDYDQYF